MDKVGKLVHEGPECPGKGGGICLVGDEETLRAYFELLLYILKADLGGGAGEEEA